MYTPCIVLQKHISGDDERRLSSRSVCAISRGNMLQSAGFHLWPCIFQGNLEDVRLQCLTLSTLVIILQGTNLLYLYSLYTYVSGMKYITALLTSETHSRLSLQSLQQLQELRASLAPLLSSQIQKCISVVSRKTYQCEKCHEMSTVFFEIILYVWGTPCKRAWLGASKMLTRQSGSAPGSTWFNWTVVTVRS